MADSGLRSSSISAVGGSHVDVSPSNSVTAASQAAAQPFQSSITDSRIVSTKTNELVERLDKLSLQAVSTSTLSDILSSAGQEPRIVSLKNLLHKHPVLMEIAQTAYDGWGGFVSNVDADMRLVWLSTVLCHFKLQPADEQWLQSSQAQSIGFGSEQMDILDDAYSEHLTPLETASDKFLEAKDTLASKAREMANKRAAAKRERQAQDAAAKRERQAQDAAAERERQAQDAAAERERQAKDAAAERIEQTKWFAGRINSEAREGANANRCLPIQQILHLFNSHPDMSEDAWTRLGVLPGHNKQLASFEDASVVHGQYGWLLSVFAGKGKHPVGGASAEHQEDSISPHATKEASTSSILPRWLDLPLLHESDCPNLRQKHLEDDSRAVTVYNPFYPENPLKVKNVRFLMTGGMMKALRAFAQALSSTQARTFCLTGPPDCGKSTWNWVLATVLALSTSSDVLYVPRALELIKRPESVVFSAFTRSSGPLAQAVANANATNASQLFQHGTEALHTLHAIVASIKSAPVQGAHAAADEPCELLFALLEYFLEANQNPRSVIIIDNPRELLDEAPQSSTASETTVTTASQSGAGALECSMNADIRKLLNALAHENGWVNRLLLLTDYAGHRVVDAWHVSASCTIFHRLESCAVADIAQILRGAPHARTAEAGVEDTPSPGELARRLHEAVGGNVGTIVWSKEQGSLLEPEKMLDFAIDRYVARLTEVLVNERKFHERACESGSLGSSRQQVGAVWIDHDFKLPYYVMCVALTARYLGASETERPPPCEELVLRLLFCDTLEKHNEQGTMLPGVVETALDWVDEENTVRDLVEGTFMHTMYNLTTKRIFDQNGKLTSFMPGSELKQHVQLDVNSGGRNTVVDDFRILPGSEKLNLLGKAKRVLSCFVGKNGGSTWHISGAAVSDFFAAASAKAYPGGAVFQTPRCFPCFDVIKASFNESTKKFLVATVETTISSFQSHSQKKAQGVAKESLHHVAKVFGDVFALAYVSCYLLRQGEKVGDFILERHSMESHNGTAIQAGVLTKSFDERGRPLMFGPMLQLLAVALNLSSTVQVSVETFLSGLEPRRSERLAAQEVADQLQQDAAAAQIVTPPSTVLASVEVPGSPKPPSMNTLFRTSSAQTLSAISSAPSSVDSSFVGEDRWVAAVEIDVPHWVEQLHTTSQRQAETHVIYKSAVPASKQAEALFERFDRNKRFHHIMQGKMPIQGGSSPNSGAGNVLDAV